MADQGFESKGNTNVNSVNWDDYGAILIQQGIPAEKHRWYLNWCQQFVRFQPALPLETRTSADIAAFLQKLAGKSRIAPWQLQQASDALKFLYADHLQRPWANPWQKYDYRAGAASIGSRRVLQGCLSS